MTNPNPYFEKYVELMSELERIIIKIQEAGPTEEERKKILALTHDFRLYQLNLIGEKPPFHVVKDSAIVGDVHQTTVTQNFHGKVETVCDGDIHIQHGS